MLIHNLCYDNMLADHEDVLWRWGRSAPVLWRCTEAVGREGTKTARCDFKHAWR